MTRLLALETATEACSVALHINGEILEHFEVAPQRHAQLILGMVEGALAQAGLRVGDLDALAFGRGPGSFTGVRIATGVVQGIAFAADLPVAPISTLATLAQEVADESGAERIVAGLDARMHEVYWGVYRIGPGGIVACEQPEQVCSPERVPIPSEHGWWGVGSAFDAYGLALALRLGDRLGQVLPQRYPRARYVAKLGVAALQRGDLVRAEAAQPVYLRDRVAWTSVKGG
jgi:tRNA threonylcarbamoyladenosine biosynthesis protein TsaB